MRRETSQTRRSRRGPHTSGSRGRRGVSSRRPSRRTPAARRARSISARRGPRNPAPPGRTSRALDPLAEAPCSERSIRNKPNQAARRCPHPVLHHQPGIVFAGVPRDLLQREAAAAAPGARLGRRPARRRVGRGRGALVELGQRPDHRVQRPPHRPRGGLDEACRPPRLNAHAPPFQRAGDCPFLLRREFGVCSPRAGISPPKSGGHRGCIPPGASCWMTLMQPSCNPRSQWGGIDRAVYWTILRLQL